MYCQKRRAAQRMKGKGNWCGYQWWVSLVALQCQEKAKNSSTLGGPPVVNSWENMNSSYTGLESTDTCNIHHWRQHSNQRDERSIWVFKIWKILSISFHKLHKKICGRFYLIGRYIIIITIWQEGRKEFQTNISPQQKHKWCNHSWYNHT